MNPLSHLNYSQKQQAPSSYGTCSNSVSSMMLGNNSCTNGSCSTNVNGNGWSVPSSNAQLQPFNQMVAAPVPISTIPAAIPCASTYQPSNIGTSAYSSAYPNVQLANGNQIVSDKRALMEVNSLMPGSWKAPVVPTCAGQIGVTDNWARYAPSQAAFKNYILTAGSARLGVNSRASVTKGRTVGQNGINLLRAPLPVPIAGQASWFNDSSSRLQLIADATGVMPAEPCC